MQHFTCTSVQGTVSHQQIIDIFFFGQGMFWHLSLLYWSLDFCICFFQAGQGCCWLCPTLYISLPHFVVSDQILVCMTALLTLTPTLLLSCPQPCQPLLLQVISLQLLCSSLFYVLSIEIPLQICSSQLFCEQAIKHCAHSKLFCVCFQGSLCASSLRA